MKGIVLAGGNGSRLFPSTLAASKQILPIYNKPAIFYPISVLMLAEVKDILIMSTPRDLPRIRDLLGDGRRLGVRFSYAEQKQPKGIAEAFLIARDFIEEAPVGLVLGDNFFYGGDFATHLATAPRHKEGAHLFAYRVEDPRPYGVVEIHSSGRALSLEEKPKEPKSHWAVTGLYFYDHQVCKFTERLKPSARGELEITDLNRLYLEAGQLSVTRLGRGTAWLDVGTPHSLLTASQFTHMIEERQGLQIANLDEVAFNKGFISREQLQANTEEYPECDYKRYLRKVLAMEQENHEKNEHESGPRVH